MAPIVLMASMASMARFYGSNRSYGPYVPNGFDALMASTNGLYGLNDSSSMTPIELMAPQPSMASMVLMEPTTLMVPMTPMAAMAPIAP